MVCLGVFVLFHSLIPAARGGSGKGGGGSFPREVLWTRLEEGTGSSSLQTGYFLAVLNLHTKPAAQLGHAVLFSTVELFVP